MSQATARRWMPQEPALFALAGAAVALALFAPYLFTGRPHLLFISDNAILYFPQFVRTLQLTREGLFAGIDFLTNNGASAFFLRPNLPTSYPPYHALALLPLESTASLAKAYVVLWWAHAALAFWACARVGRARFGLDARAASLMALLYTGAIARFAFTMPVFFYPAALFPWVLATALDHAQPTLRVPSLLRRSVPWFLLLTAGYLPLDLHAAALALGFALWSAYAGRTPGVPLRPRLLQAVLPAAIAAMLVSPLYLALVQYHRLVPGLPAGAWQSAHHLAYSGRDLLGLLSAGLHSTRPAGEWPHVLLGLPALLVVLMAFVHRSRLLLTPVQVRLALACSCLFAFHLLLSLGPRTGLPDLFYHFVPGLGRMHFYGRYLLVASFFWFLLVAVLLPPLVQAREELPVGRWLLGVVALAMLAQGLAQAGTAARDLRLDPDLLAVELLMAALVLLGLLAPRPSHALAALGVVTLLLAVGNTHHPTNLFSAGQPAPFTHHLSNTPQRQQLLLDYFDRHSDKALIKFADLAADIERQDGVGRNWPWMVRSGRPVSNYMGYELHTSVDRQYLDRFPYFGVVDFEWMLRTGAQFVVWREPAERYAPHLKDWIDPAVPVLDLGQGHRAARLRDAAGRLDGFAPRAPGDFDNGFIRVTSAGHAPASVTRFHSDGASGLRFEVDSPGGAVAQLLLFPNKTMALRVDGRTVAPPLRHGLATLELPAGRHRVEYVYANPLHRAYTLAYALYLLALAALAARHAAGVLRRRRQGTPAMGPSDLSHSAPLEPTCKP